jgi:hypothetical protein
MSDHGPPWRDEDWQHVEEDLDPYWQDIAALIETAPPLPQRVIEILRAAGWK